MGEKTKLVRAVIDTNVFISSILFEGKANQLVNYWQGKKFVFLISRPILEEYIKVLSYPKFKLSEDQIKHVIENELLPFVEVVEIKTSVYVVKKDPGDNKFISTALDGKADYLVSGDEHLSSLGKYKNIAIIELKEFLDILRKNNPFDQNVRSSWYF